ncbi:circumsporozoite protein-like isoform X3 [Schistocerca nitens]|uniref:circumsporozoite protein-like isoform X3 n=1 Tax=Schistocerca nitens TaxID=7011 RepID=UPI0021187E95|nr:circumsporozoite protein-like isoform X3 [Schistocerca nitens]
MFLMQQISTLLNTVELILSILRARRNKHHLQQHLPLCRLFASFVNEKRNHSSGRNSSKHTYLLTTYQVPMSQRRICYWPGQTDWARDWLFLDLDDSDSDSDDELNAARLGATTSCYDPSAAPDACCCSYNRPWRHTPAVKSGFSKIERSKDGFKETDRLARGSERLIPIIKVNKPALTSKMKGDKEATPGTSRSDVVSGSDAGDADDEGGNDDGSGGNDDGNGGNDDVSGGNDDGNGGNDDGNGGNDVSGGNDDGNGGNDYGNGGNDDVSGGNDDGDGGNDDGDGGKASCACGNDDGNGGNVDGNDGNVDGNDGNDDGNDGNDDGNDGNYDVSGGNYDVSGGNDDGNGGNDDGNGGNDDGDGGNVDDNGGDGGDLG